jgi:deoxycytidine triphosphate deaminase
MNNKILRQIGENVSILVDHNIKELANGDDGLLIGENYDEKQVKFASYELRVSNKIGMLSSNNDGILGVHKKFIPDEEKNIDIKPNQTLRLYTFEKLRLPVNVLARISVVGQVFATGLFAENTFADPGFGLEEPLELYITVVNTTSKIIRLPIKSRLARIEFYRIGDGVQKSFTGGSSDIHLTYLNAYKACIDKPSEDDQEKLFEKFSDNLINYRDEDRCVQHFAIMQKSILEEQKSNLEVKDINKKLRERLNILQLIVFFIFLSLTALIAYTFIPKTLSLVSLLPVVFSFIYPFFNKNMRTALNDLTNTNKK